MPRKRKSPLKIGKETYGEMDPKEAFFQAFAPYFVPKKPDTTATNAIRLTGTG